MRFDVPMRHISDPERRARLGRRHRLAPEFAAESPEQATRAVVALHATDPGSVYLSAAARAPAVGPEALGRSLYEARTLVRQLAMRRTLFVFPRDLVPAVWASAGARTAEFERRRIVRDLVASAATDDGDGWLGEARAEVLAALAGGPMSARALRAVVPRIDRTVTMSPGTKWGGEVPLTPRILAWLGARGDVMRGPNDGGWWVSRPLWAATSDWLGDAAFDHLDLDPQAGYRQLVELWLRAFAPGTEADLVWWLGGTKTAVRQALRDVQAVAVTLDSGDVGWVLPDDEEPEPDPGHWAALLPALDPTTMGWKQRDFYLDPQDTPFLFDTAGNGGTTAWLDGRIVGSWVQDADGTVEVLLRRDVPAAGRTLLDRQAARLTTWLDGRVLSSPYMRSQRLGLPLR